MYRERNINVFAKDNSFKGEISIDEPLNTDWDGNELLLSDILGSDPDIVSRNIETQDEKSILLAAVDRLEIARQTDNETAVRTRWIS